MKRLVRFVAVCFISALACGAAAVAETPKPDGLWRTISDVDGKPRGLVRLKVADGVLTGRLAGSLRGEPADSVCGKCTGAFKDAPLKDLRFLWNLKPDPKNPLNFTGGSILDPDSGRTFSARLTLAPDGKTLKLRGYLGSPALGRTQTWERAEAE